jgi:lipopolysaccharide biosynthesis regulator YciM
MHRTKTEAALADAEAAHADDPERAALLRHARRFKASWIELAEALTRVKRSGRWQRWGFESFEAYAKSELHLRGETVDKLTGSYAFLQRRAPSVLARDGVREAMPSYQAVDFLRRAEENESAPQEAVDEVRRRVLDEAAPAAAVARAFRDVVFPVDDDTRRARDVAGLKNVASRLRELLGETKIVPRRLAGEVDSALARLLDALEAKGDRAA